LLTSARSERIIPRPPLSSQGVLKALRSGIFAAYAAGDLLTSGDERGMRRYDHFIRQEFAAYLRARSCYYAQERRWPAREFWRRRHAPELAGAS
jgi:hypothetical protein